MSAAEEPEYGPIETMVRQEIGSLLVTSDLSLNAILDPDELHNFSRQLDDVESHMIRMTIGTANACCVLAAAMDHAVRATGASGEKEE